LLLHSLSSSPIARGGFSARVCTKKRLRCPLQLLLLVVAASVVVSDRELPEWNKCGITKLCIIHKSCADTQSADKGWTTFTSPQFNPVDLTPPTHFEKYCKRPLVWASEALVIMRDVKVTKEDGMTLFFKSINTLRPKILCKNDNALADEAHSFLVNDMDDNSDPYVYCILKISVRDSTDIRKKIT
ncbi:hypothetical protein PENTCL1PPCAC_23734, partial [Pristionchus entomophagus]